MKITIKSLLYCIVFIALISNSFGQEPKTFDDHIKFLASDDLKGRKPGTQGDMGAATYIIEQFKNNGLKPMKKNGFQYFEVVTDVKAGPGNALSFDNYSAALNDDFAPFSFSSNTTLTSEVVFVGYGFEINEDSLNWNDYKGIDVKGKWVMVLRGDPEPETGDSKFIKYSEEQDKVLTATDKGAAGVLFVSSVGLDKKDELVSMFFDKSIAKASIPVIHIKRALANKILECKNRDIEKLEADINKNMTPNSFMLSKKVTTTTNVFHTKVKTQNVIAVLEGSDPKLKDEFILVGAHYDHLGMGGPGSGSRKPDTVAIHNGADDNASGVAGVIELAGKFASQKEKPARSIIFMAFGAEELGLLGSKYFVNNPLVDLKKIKTMINIDMIGRLKPGSKELSIGGTGTFIEAGALINKHKIEGLKLGFSPDGYGPSDHASFYGENIPVLFITTGAHTDYHTPEDDIEKINFEGGHMVVEFLYNLITDLSNTEKSITFQEAGSKEGFKRKSRFKVTLGIMPGFGSSDNNGLRVDGVVNGGPAFKGKMLKGDIITALDGKVVKNIQEYMFRLKKLEPGQIITVDVNRNGEKVILLVQL